MNKIRFVALGIGSLFVTGAFALVACSTDTEVSAVDAGADTSTDSPARDETAPPDGSGDAGSDDADSSPFDGGYTALNFRELLAAASCRTSTRCCFGYASLPGDASVDGGHYDQAKCLELFQGAGFEGSLLGTDALDAGSLVVDQQKADDCVKGLEGLPCTPDGAAVAALREACFAAIQGTATAGQPCVNSASCAPGHFCHPDAGGADAGTKCEALRGVDASCGDLTSDLAEIDHACSWRGKGGDRFCQYYADFWSDTMAPQDQWRCETAHDGGDTCINDAWCKAGVCDTVPATTASWTCQSPGIMFPPEGLCTAIRKP